MTSRKASAGFTLMELLVAVIIISALLALVLPRFGSIRENTYVATMKNSIAKAITSQEFYMNENDQYASSFAQLSAATGYVPDNDVTLTVATTPNPKYGYCIKANHAKTETACAVEFGLSGPGGVEFDGKIYCDADGTVDQITTLTACR